MKPQTRAQKRADLQSWIDLGKTRDDRERKAAEYFSQNPISAELVSVSRDAGE